MKDTIETEIKTLNEVFKNVLSEKDIELHSTLHSEDMDLRPNTYTSYKEGMEDCIDLIKKKLNLL